jgi:hypothetical protein
MPLYLLGGGGGDAPFNRTFFNVTLGELTARSGRDQNHKLTLFLIDGAQLEVCAIDELADAYVVLRAYRSEEEDSEINVNLIPYNIIYRMELAPRQSASSSRLGFRWTPSAARKSTSIRKPTK